MKSTSTFADLSRLSSWKHLAMLYIFTFGVVSAMYEIMDYAQWARLARSYASVCRNNLLIGDSRQAVSALAMALEDGFSSVSVISGDSQPRIDVPNSRIAEESRGPLSIAIEVPVFINAEMKERKSYLLVFIYSFKNSVSVIGSLAVLIFFLIIALGRIIKSRVQHELEFESAVKQVSFQRSLQLQIAHDIRSPLSVINLVLNNLPELPIEKAKLLSSSAARINGIAQDLLSSAKHEAGKVAGTTNKIASEDSIDVHEFLREIYSEKRMQFGQSQLFDFELVLNSVSSTRCRISKSNLGRVISNLINNSVEALPGKGRIALSISSSNKYLTIGIYDDGKGIPQEILSRLGNEQLSFGKNFQGSGSGLGLYSARKIIGAAGGNLRIQSREGEGTLVTINLPLASDITEAVLPE